MLMVQPVLGRQTLADTAATAGPSGATSPTGATATASTAGSTEHTTEWHWVQSRDGQTALAHGTDATALLPRDDDVVLVLPVLATSWHQLTLPRINTARLRQALDGLLEDRLLADTASLHLALQPGLQPGQTGWVAACQRTQLTQWLGTLHNAGRPASRIVPDLCPQPEAQLHALDCADSAWLVSAGPLGVLTAPLPAAHLPPAVLAAMLRTTPDTPRQAEPACAGAAELALDAPFALQTTAQRLLASSQTGWNLAQFDVRLSAGARRGQRWAQALRMVVHAPAWKPARWGMAVLVASLLLGLNASAWQERRSLQAKRAQINQLLTQTFPQVTLVLDAPLQMQREVARLARSAGDVSPGDLEPFLQSFSAFSLDGIVLSAIEYAPSDIQLTLNNPNPQSLQAVRDGLQNQGWRTRYTAPVLSVQPAPLGVQP